MEVWPIAGTILGVFAVVSAAVFTGVKYVTSNREKAEANSKEEMVSCEARHVKAMEGVSAEMSELSTQVREKLTLQFDHLNEIDLWRKEINGQLKLYGQQAEFANKILDEQKSHISTLATAQQQSALALVRISTAMEMLGAKSLTGETK